MRDRADRAAQLGEAAQAADRGVAGIGALGRNEIIEHTMAVIGAEDDLPVGRTPRVLLKQRLQQESTCSAQTTPSDDLPPGTKCSSNHARQS